MINFILPNFFENYMINHFLLYQSKVVRAPVFKTDLQFTYVSGSFPFSSWNGGLNNNKGVVFPLYSEYSLYEKVMVPIRFNCNNVCLEQFDYTDEHMNVILKINENGANTIEITNLELMMYIAEKYPLYKFIFSERADLIKPYTIEDINEVSQLEQFDIIKIPQRFNTQIDELKQIQKKNKVEIIVNTRCPLNCEHYNQCSIKEDEEQNIFISNGTIENCQKNISFTTSLNQAISLKDITEIYEPLGFRNFSMLPILNTHKFENVLVFFKYFFKEEYVAKMLEEFNSFAGGILDNND